MLIIWDLDIVKCYRPWRGYGAGRVPSRKESEVRFGITYTIWARNIAKWWRIISKPGARQMGLRSSHYADMQPSEEWLHSNHIVYVCSTVLWWWRLCWSVNNGWLDDKVKRGSIFKGMESPFRSVSIGLLLESVFNLSCEFTRDQALSTRKSGLVEAKDTILWYLCHKLGVDELIWY